MMMTAMAISPMMRNVLSVATMLPTVVMASDMARIAPTIVPMIRRMSPVCAPGPLAGYGRAGPSRMRRWAPQRPLEQPRFAQCKPPAMLTAGDSSRAGTGNMCVRIADIEAVDNCADSAIGPTPGRGGSRSVTSVATQPVFAKPCPPVRCSRVRRADPGWLSDL